MLARTFLLSLAACHRLPPPAADPGEPITLEAAVFAPRRLATDEVVDVIIPSDAQATRDDVWGTADVAGDVKVFARVAPPERLVLVLPDDAPDSATVRVRALPPPSPSPLTLRQTTRAPVAEVASGDARGPVAEFSFTLDIASRVTLEWTTHHTGSGAHAGPHQVSAQLYGPVGPEQAEVFFDFDEPERGKSTWDLGPGLHVLRAVPDVSRVECEAFDEPFGPITPPAWCDLADDGSAFDLEVSWLESTPLDTPPVVTLPPPADVVLSAGDDRQEAPGREPPAPTATFPAQRGHDLVIRWTPADERLGYRWSSEAGESYGACEEGACRFWNVRFDEVEMSIGVREAPAQVTLEATSLPLPTDRITLDPNTMFTGLIQPSTPGDPRGPILDFAVRVITPGRYRLGISYPEGTAQPRITPLDEGLEDLHLNAFSPEPYEASWFDVAAPGLYGLRVHTTPDGPAVNLEVAWQQEE